MLQVSQLAIDAGKVLNTTKLKNEIDEVIAFESRLAAILLTPSDIREPERQLNVVTLEELQRRMPMVGIVSSLFSIKIFLSDKLEAIIVDDLLA